MQDLGQKINGTTINISSEKIDARKAAFYLNRNVSSNRHHRPRVVAMYASDMLNGTWKLTSETIKFDTGNNLFDGQHRLLAVIEADKVRPGIAVEMMVARGIDPSAMIVVDRGAPRRPGDAVRISGVTKYESAKAALAKRIILFERGLKSVFAVNGRVGLDSRAIVTTTEVVDYVQRFDDELEVFAAAGLSFHGSQIINLMTPTDWAFSYWILSKTDMDGGKYFLGRLATLEDIPKTSPIRMLFSRIPELKPSEKLDELLLAFDAYCRGKARYKKGEKVVIPSLFNQK